MIKVPLTYEEVIANLPRGTHIRKEYLKEKYGEEAIGYIPNIGSKFPGGEASYYLYCKSGYVLFPESGTNYLPTHMIVKLDEEIAEMIEKIMDEYKEYQKNLTKSISDMEQMIKSQKIKRLFC